MSSSSYSDAPTTVVQQLSRGSIHEAIKRVFPAAVMLAAGETGLDVHVFPASSPYTTHDLLNSDFWPDSVIGDIPIPKSR